jgi:predicted transcriptional regulator
MAMTLRLSDSETTALRQCAERQGRPAEEIARQAIREYVESHSRSELLDRVLDEELPRYAGAAERLGT